MDYRFLLTKFKAPRAYPVRFGVPPAVFRDPTLNPEDPDHEDLIKDKVEEYTLTPENLAAMRTEFKEYCKKLSDGDLHGWYLQEIVGRDLYSEPFQVAGTIGQPFRLTEQEIVTAEDWYDYEDYDKPQILNSKGVIEHYQQYGFVQSFGEDRLNFDPFYAMLPLPWRNNIADRYGRWVDAAFNRLNTLSKTHYYEEPIGYFAGETPEGLAVRPFSGVKIRVTEELTAAMEEGDPYPEAFLLSDGDFRHPGLVFTSIDISSKLWYFETSSKFEPHSEDNYDGLIYLRIQTCREDTPEDLVPLPVPPLADANSKYYRDIATCSTGSDLSLFSPLPPSSSTPDYIGKKPVLELQVAGFRNVCLQKGNTVATYTYNPEVPSRAFSFYQEDAATDFGPGDKFIPLSTAIANSTYAEEPPASDLLGRDSFKWTSRSFDSVDQFNLAYRLGVESPSWSSAGDNPLTSSGALIVYGQDGFFRLHDRVSSLLAANLTEDNLVASWCLRNPEGKKIKVTGFGSIYFGLLRRQLFDAENYSNRYSAVTPLMVATLKDDPELPSDTQFTEYRLAGEVDAEHNQWGALQYKGTEGWTWSTDNPWFLRGKDPSQYGKFGGYANTPDYYGVSYLSDLPPVSSKTFGYYRSRGLYFKEDGSMRLSPEFVTRFRGSIPVLALMGNASSPFSNPLGGEYVDYTSELTISGGQCVSAAPVTTSLALFGNIGEVFTKDTLSRPGYDRKSDPDMPTPARVFMSGSYSYRAESRFIFDNVGQSFDSFVTGIGGKIMIGTPYDMFTATETGYSPTARSVAVFGFSTFLPDIADGLEISMVAEGTVVPSAGEAQANANAQSYVGQNFSPDGTRLVDCGEGYAQVFMSSQSNTYYVMGDNQTLTHKISYPEFSDPQFSFGEPPEWGFNVDNPTVIGSDISPIVAVADGNHPYASEFPKIWGGFLRDHYVYGYSEGYGMNPEHHIAVISKGLTEMLVHISGDIVEASNRNPGVGEVRLEGNTGATYTSLEAGWDQVTLTSETGMAITILVCVLPDFCLLGKLTLPMRANRRGKGISGKFNQSHNAGDTSNFPLTMQGLRIQGGSNSDFSGNIRYRRPDLDLAADEDVPLFADFDAQDSAEEYIQNAQANTSGVYWAPGTPSLQNPGQSEFLLKESGLVKAMPTVRPEIATGRYPDERQVEVNLSLALPFYVYFVNEAEGEEYLMLDASYNLVQYDEDNRRALLDLSASLYDLEVGKTYAIYVQCRTTLNTVKVDELTILPPLGQSVNLGSATPAPTDLSATQPAGSSGVLI